MGRGKQMTGVKVNLHRRKDKVKPLNPKLKKTNKKKTQKTFKTTKKTFNAA